MHLCIHLRLPPKDGQRNQLNDFCNDNAVAKTPCSNPTGLHDSTKHKSILAVTCHLNRKQISTFNAAVPNHKTQSPKNECKTISTEERCRQYCFKCISASTWGSHQKMGNKNQLNDFCNDNAVAKTPCSNPTGLHGSTKHKSILAVTCHPNRKQISTFNAAVPNHKTQSPKNECKTISTEERCRQYCFKCISASTWGSHQKTGNKNQLNDFCNDNAVAKTPLCKSFCV